MDKAGTLVLDNLGEYQFESEAVRKQVLNFVGEHPFLRPLLVEAPGFIEKYFSGSKLFLKVFTDPEAVGKHHLVIFIATKYGSKETLERLDQLDEAWWLAALDKAQGKLSINVTFP
jgi:hypothetical protein